MQRTIHLDRVALDGFVVRRRSATMMWEQTREQPLAEPGRGWHAYIACGSLPARIQAGPTPILLDATLSDGRTLSTAATVVERQDDAYGTVLRLVDPSSPGL